MTYTIALKPEGKRQVTAASSDGYTFTTRTPLLSGARYWQQAGGPSSATIVTIWSSGSTEWALRSTVRAAANLTVIDPDKRRPYFRQWSQDPLGDV